MRTTFKVYERLKREQHIDTLFRTGKAYSVFPIRVIFKIVARPADGRSPVLAGFSVPKKKFAASVHRHRIRRLMVEAWRLNKDSLYQAVPAGVQIHLFFIFTDQAIPEFTTIRDACIKSIHQLAAIAAATEIKTS